MGPEICINMVDSSQNKKIFDKLSLYDKLIGNKLEHCN